ncbi:FCD domain-containing protein [Bosea sp. 117]|uniref:GntR family transcriptional regulator n=1 Tax=Bosea sp. 117 TaxID=1125973 RepID=UPI00068FBA63|nr:FCD domain-containing protein [Bosea sp. 117]
MITTDLHPVDEEGAQEFRSRTSETYARIHGDVVSGKLKPGVKLKIEQLREEYDVGATPVREALSFLAADGLVVREDQKGFRVAEVSADEFEDLLAVRCMIEERALRLAISRGGRKWEEGIVLARFRLSGVGRIEGNEAEWERHHRAFHMSLLAACGSSLLLRLSKQFYDENNRYRHLSRLNHATTRDVRGEHEEIAEAVLARDTDRAVGLLVEHYTKTGNLLRIALKDLATDGHG